jgi:hypothetical protein
MRYRIRNMHRCALCLLVLASCSSKRSAHEAPQALAAAIAPKADLPLADGQASPAAKMPARKVIRDGELYLVVKSYAPARQAVETLVARLGGYVAASQVDHGDGDATSAQITLRIPADRFDEARGGLTQLGTLQHESTHANDITEQYYDVKARLGNAKRVESRLVELAKQTGKVSDLLEVEREMARVREQIELFEGKLRLYDSQVELSTLVVHLQMREKYVTSTPTLGEDARETLGDSWRALRSFVRGLALVVVALVPWSPLIALPVWLLLRWRARRKIRRRPGA